MIRVMAVLPLLVMSLATPTPAWDGVSVLQATADLDWEEYVDSSPVPVNWLYWDAEAYNGIDLVGHYGDGPDELRPVDWFACCTGDSMVFSGAWPEHDPDNWIWNLVFFRVELHVQAVAWNGVRIVATRSADGNLSVDEHRVTVTDTSGLDVPLLADDSGDEGVLDLPPGAVFMVTMNVHARENGTHYAYDGQVRVRFEDPSATPVSAVTWSAVKDLFD